MQVQKCLSRLCRPLLDGPLAFYGRNLANQRSRQIVQAGLKWRCAGFRYWADSPKGVSAWRWKYVGEAVRKSVPKESQSLWACASVALIEVLFLVEVFVVPCRRKLLGIKLRISGLFRYKKNVPPWSAGLMTRSVVEFVTANVMLFSEIAIILMKKKNKRQFPENLSASILFLFCYFFYWHFTSVNYFHSLV